jgi:hypothetical protein
LTPETTHKKGNASTRGQLLQRQAIKDTRLSEIEQECPARLGRVEEGSNWYLRVGIEGRMDEERRGNQEGSFDSAGGQKVLLGCSTA